MGQAKSQLKHPPQPNQELQLVDTAQNLYMNIRNNKLYIKNDVFVGNIEDVQYQLDIYQFRRLNDSFVVSVDYCEIDQEEDICSKFSTLKYFIEKQEHTLLEKQQINIQEGIRLLIQVLTGFEILYQKFGYFKPSAQLIFFNHFQEVKVWINENPKTTKNLQFPHCPKNIGLENSFIRESVKLFDCLRDPLNPLFRYTECLGRHFLTFKTTIQAFSAKLIEMQNDRKKIMSPLCETHSIRRYTSPVIQRTVNPMLVTQTQTIVHSPRTTAFNSKNISPRNSTQIPKMSIGYSSPQPKDFPQPLPFRQSVKASLTKSSLNSHFRHRTKLSKDFPSTMPNSLKNSKVQQKNICIETLTPVLSSVSSMNTPYPESINWKKQTSQRYSELEPTSFGQQIPKKQTVSNSPHISIIKESTIRFQNLPIEELESDVSQRGINSNLEQHTFRKDYHVHKRHRTDYKLAEKENSNAESSMGQKSAIDGTFMGRFNCNTIQSIHLLEQDRERDSQILTDLKHIINKYRLNG